MKTTHVRSTVFLEPQHKSHERTLSLHEHALGYSQAAATALHRSQKKTVRRYQEPPIASDSKMRFISKNHNFGQEAS